MTSPTLERPTQEKVVQLNPTAYCIGFPKAGTHLYSLMLAVLCQEANPERNWFGSIAKHGWTTEWINLGAADWYFRRMTRGTFVKGHTGYHKVFKDALCDAGIATLFVYRDFRDVAVSQAFHVLSGDDTRRKHLGKAVYKALESFEDVLIAVIEGIDEWPGLFERWAMYAPWLDEAWVLSVSFEQARQDLKPTAEKLTKYLFGMDAIHRGYSYAGMDEIEFNNIVLSMCQATRRTDLSPTFRKGKVGGWRKHFTPRVTDVFKEHAGEWLIRLGYEKDKDW